MSNKTKNIIITIVFILYLFTVLVLNLLKPETLISNSERRKLNTFPKFSIEKLFNRNFMEEFDKFSMDQFIYRDNFRKLKTNFELNILNKSDVNNIYFYEDFLINKEYPLNMNMVENTVTKMNNIKENYLTNSGKIYYSIIPDKNYFLNENYLKMDYSQIENYMQCNLKDMEYIEIMDCLELTDYYYSDSHWKQENIEKVADKIATQMGFNNRIKTSFDIKQITDFRGVYSGQLQVDTNQDYINILTNNIIEKCKTYNIENQEETPIYNMQKINSKDKFDIYLSGATPIIFIENEFSETDKELIIFRDSFGSCLAPLFAEAFKKITLIDTRYISPKYIEKYVDFEGKDILFIYSTLLINNSTSLK